MKTLLIVGTKSIAGGASVASLALYHSLLPFFRVYFFDSSSGAIYCGNTSTLVIRIKPSFLNQFGALALRALTKTLKLINLFPKLPISWGVFEIYNIDKVVDIVQPDIINIHWLGNEFVSLRRILSLPISVILTLHDAWPVSGLSHVVFPKSLANSSPYNGYWLYRKIDLHLTKRKTMMLLAFPPLKILAPSKFLYDYVYSILPNNLCKSLSILPNLVPQPNLEMVKSSLAAAGNSASSNTSVVNIAYGAAVGASPIVKGFDLFEQILQILSSELSDTEAININLFGEAAAYFAKKNILLRNINFTFFQPQHSIADIISSSRIYCSTSRSETFGLLLAEMAQAGRTCVFFSGVGSDDILKYVGTKHLNPVSGFNVSLYAHNLLKCIKSTLNHFEDIRMDLGSADNDFVPSGSIFEKMNAQVILDYITIINRAD